MSLKQELQVWDSALKAFDSGDHATALARFEEIADTSKVLFNMGLIHAIDGEHDQAVALFDQAIALDKFLAIAYFQSGVSQFLLGRFEAARRDFSDALALFRENHTIDYEQLGLKFKLFSCEVRFNRGLALIYMGRLEEGMLDLMAARDDKQTTEHDVIDEACADQAVGYTVFSIPVGRLFRPSDTKLQNLEARDYLGKAKVIAATNSHDLYTGFSGVKKLAATAGVAPPDGFAQGVETHARPRRTNTGDGRLERAATDARASPALSSKGGGSAALGRSQTTRVPSTFTGTTTISRSRSTVSGRSVKPSPLPTPPSSSASSHEEQVFPPPKGLLHARSSSSSLSGSTSQRYPERSGTAPLQGFYTPPRPPRPSGDLLTLAPPATSLSTRRGRKPVPIEPLAPLEVPRPANPVPPGEPSPSGQSPERVASWAQGQRFKHDRAMSSPPALPTTPREPALTLAPAPGPGLSRTASSSSKASPSSLAYVAEDSESDKGASEPFSLARYDSVVRSVSRATSRVGGSEAGETMQVRKVEASHKEGRNPGRRMGAVEMLASEMRTALQVDDRGPQYEGAAEPGRMESQEGAGGTPKIRVKLQYLGETRALNIAAGTALGEFVERVRRKFGSETNLPIKYRDSDGTLVSILDKDDWECALDSAHDVAAGGKCTGKLDIVVGG